SATGLGEPAAPMTGGAGRGSVLSSWRSIPGAGVTCSIILAPPGDGNSQERKKGPEGALFACPADRRPGAWTTHCTRTNASPCPRRIEATHACRGSTGVRRPQRLGSCPRPRQRRGRLVLLGAEFRLHHAAFGR